MGKEYRSLAFALDDGGFAIRTGDSISDIC
jgi:hypothetical protein